jgi:hypothetical protein
MTRAVFTGGTGRSGTTVLGHLLDNHPELGRTMPREVRFITERGGLLDVLATTSGDFASRVNAKDPLAWSSRARFGATQILPRPVRLRLGGRMQPAEFTERLRTYWFSRTGSDGKTRGLHRGMSEESLSDALRDFEENFQVDPINSSRALSNEILMRICSGKAGWVETTPDNAIRADGLLALMPEAKIIHVVRDGRDVASSVVGRSWGPSDHVNALRWWGQRMARAYTTLAGLPSESVLTLRLEDLAVRDREASYKRLLDFIEIDDHPALREFFDEFIIERRLHQGRWRDELAGVSANQFNDMYGQILTSLQRDFGNVAPTQDLPTR